MLRGGSERASAVTAAVASAALAAALTATVAATALATATLTAFVAISAVATASVAAAAISTFSVAAFATVSVLVALDVMPVRVWVQPITSAIDLLGWSTGLQETAIALPGGSGVSHSIYTRSAVPTNPKSQPCSCAPTVMLRRT